MFSASMAYWLLLVVTRSQWQVGLTSSMGSPLCSHSNHSTFFELAAWCRQTEVHQLCLMLWWERHNKFWLDAWQSSAWARPAQMCLRNSGVTRPKFTKFLTDILQSSAVLTRVSMLQSSHPLWNTSAQNEGGYANFHWIAPKIGYHSNVHWAIAKRRRIDHAHPYVYLSSTFGEDQSSAFWDD